MRIAEIYRNGVLAGVLAEDELRHFTFEYDNTYLMNPDHPAISLTIPKSKKKHLSERLFPFFFNMLSEGVNRKLQCRTLGIDENDHFGLLLATARIDTIGAVTIKQVSP